MSHTPLLVGPVWPPALTHYEHALAFAKCDWAWEAARRNPAYQKDALSFTSAFDQTELPNGALITRLRAGIPESAKAWGPCPFC